MSILCAVSVLLVASCAKEANTSQGGTQVASVLERIKTRRTIHAGIIPYPPFVTKNPNTNEYSGYFVEFMNEIVKFMGDEDNPVRIEYEETTWGGMVAGLKQGQVDVVVSGVFRTIPRAMEVTWPRACMYVGMSALVRADDGRFRTPSDLETSGVRIAVAAGEVGDEYRRRFLPHCKPIVLQTADTAATALEVSTGSADVALAESVALIRYAKEHPEVQVLFSKEPLFTYAATVMVRRGDREWVDFLDIAIEFLQLAGVTDRLDRKYNPDGEYWISPSKPWQ
jgi:polar amino acid transport system substrate-binding protein